MQKVMPKHTQTVVIGGGIVGCSVAYHLAKNGHDVVLLERKRLTSGSTWHAAGLVSQFHGFPCVTKLACYGLDLMQELQAETGVATGFKNVGATAIALNSHRQEELLRRKDAAVGQGVEVHSLSIEELQQQWPLLNTAGVLEAIHFPNDGQTNPIDTSNALARGARMAGAQIYEQTEVIDLIIENQCARGVRTLQGELRADNVVNCTGIWGHSFAKNNGTFLPIQHNQHFYIVSEPIVGLTDPTPVLRVYDEQAYYKEDAGKLMIGFAELNGLAWQPETGIPDDFEFDELPYPEGHLDPVLEKCLERVPALGEVGVRLFFNGPEGYTPDGRYYLGEDNSIRNLFIAAGFNSSGIQNGPGAGMALAEWILAGHATRDLVDVDCRRIIPFQAESDYLAARGAETLSETYAMHWPYKQRNSSRDQRLSPIHAQLHACGAVFGESAGWERPMWFAPQGSRAEYQYGYNKTPWFEHWAAEHHAVRNDVGLSDLSPFCKLLVQGDDAQSFMQLICTNDLAVAPGRVVYTQWLNERAGIEADVTVARLAIDQYLVMTSATTGHVEKRWLEKNKPDDCSVDIFDISSTQAVFGISGPRARGFLSAFTDTDLSNEAFPFGTSQYLSLADIPVRAQRISYTGELGWEVFVDTTRAVELFEALMSSTMAKAPKLVGLHAGESLRTEKAYRHWGHDIAYLDTPLEAGLMFASKMNKSSQFIGQQALSKHIDKPNKRQLVQLLLTQNDRFIYHNEPVYLNDELVGTVSTGTYSHTFNAPIGLAWITLPKHLRLDDVENHKIEVMVAGDLVAANVHQKPIYDPQNLRLKS